MRFPSFKTEWSGMRFKPSSVCSRHAAGQSNDGALARAWHPMRPDKRTDGKIDKCDRQYKINIKMSMVRTELPVCTQPPNSLDKKQSENGKENSGDLIPERSSSMGKGSPESLPKTASAPCCPACDILWYCAAHGSRTRLRSCRISFRLGSRRCSRRR